MLWRLEAPIGPVVKLRSQGSAGAEVRVSQVGVEGLFGDPEAAAELYGFELAAMDQPIDRHLGDSEDRGDFGDGQELAAWRLLPSGVTPPGSADVDSSFIVRLSFCTPPRWLPLQRRRVQK